MIQINASRLLADLTRLRSFGASGTGVIRPSLSEPDLQARRWLAERMTDAGLQAGIDGIGNVFGRSKNPGKALLLGSHSDTQPTGGWLDGALGVIYAIETARALAEDSNHNTLAVDTVAWVDEESTFASCLGSRAFSGLLGDSEMATARNPDGLSLLDALRNAGLDGVGTAVDQARYIGYLEAHIEQGPHLEASGDRIGVVTSIAGSRNFTVRFSGQQNHAGTTPMPLRQDAGIALMTFGYRLDHAFRKIAGPRSVWTMGRAQFLPGAASIIPGAAELHLQFRDPEDATLDRLQDCAFDLAGELNRDSEVKVSIDVFSPPTHPARMDEGFQKHMARSAEKFAPGQWQSMPSAAVHDAMFVANVMPAGMLFIPSINGISHDFSENSHDSDIVLGCEVFADAVASILNSSNH